jgi:hypothetical protein
MRLRTKALAVLGLTGAAGAVVAAGVAHVRDLWRMDMTEHLGKGYRQGREDEAAAMRQRERAARGLDVGGFTEWQASGPGRTYRWNLGEPTDEDWSRAELRVGDDVSVLGPGHERIGRVVDVEQTEDGITFAAQLADTELHRLMTGGLGGERPGLWAVPPARPEDCEQRPSNVEPTPERLTEEQAAELRAFARRWSNGGRPRPEHRGPVDDANQGEPC